MLVYKRLSRLVEHKGTVPIDVTIPVRLSLLCGILEYVPTREKEETITLIEKYLIDNPKGLEKALKEALKEENKEKESDLHE